MSSTKPCKNHRLAMKEDIPEHTGMVNNGVKFKTCANCGWDIIKK